MRLVSDPVRLPQEAKAVNPAPGPLHQIVIRIWEPALAEYLTGKRTILNIPEGAKVISAWFDRSYPDNEDRNFLCIRIEHESLPEHVPGSKLPVQRAKFRRAAMSNRKSPQSITVHRKAKAS